METIGKLLTEIKSLQKWEKNELLKQLIQRGTIDYVEFSKYYVDHLQALANKNAASISHLVLMLSVYAMTDTSNTGKAARQHIYESGYYHENDGSAFGKQLGEEFKNNSNDIRDKK